MRIDSPWFALSMKIAVTLFFSSPRYQAWKYSAKASSRQTCRLRTCDQLPRDRAETNLWYAKFSRSRSPPTSLAPAEIRSLGHGLCPLLPIDGKNAVSVHENVGNSEKYSQSKLSNAKLPLGRSFILYKKYSQNWHGKKVGPCSNSEQESVWKFHHFQKLLKTTYSSQTRTPDFIP